MIPVPAHPRRTNRQRPPVRYNDSIDLRPGEEDDRDGLLAYWQIVQRHKAGLIACCLAGGLLGLLFALQEDPIYRSRVSLEIQTLNEDFLNRRAVDPTADNYSADSYMQTQIRLLQTSSLVERVARKLKAQGLPNETVSVGPLVRLRKTIFSSGEDPHEVALQKAAGSVAVRGSGMTRIVEVFCESTHPKMAAEFANLLANEYIQNSLEVRAELSKRTSNDLAQQLKDAKVRLEQSEALLQSKAQELGLELASENENLIQGELQQLQNELLRAQAERIQKQSRYELIRTPAGETLPEVLDDPALREYRSKLAELQRQMAELNASVTAAHPKALRLAPQIAMLKASVESERANILRKIENEYEAAARREALLKKNYLERAHRTSTQAVRAIQYRIAKREVDSNRQLYDGMLQKVTEAEVAATMHSRNARIVDAATPAGAPVKPNPPLTAAVGAILGSFVGMGIVLVRERSYQRYITPGTLASSPNVRQLGAIPPTSRSLPATWWRPNLPKIPMLSAGGNGSGLVETERGRRSQSQLAESFHFALTSILFSAVNEQPKVLVITSPGAREGKTLASTNLALACTRIGLKVLLVDGNLRQPQLNHVFNLPESPGFCELLTSDGTVPGQALSEYLQPTGFPGLFVLPAGAASGSVAAMLFSLRMNDLMTVFRQEFDLVFIDAPAVLQTSEARVFARYADGTVVVVRAGKTTCEAAKWALDRLADDGSPVVGTLLNDWQPFEPAAA